MKYFNSDLWMNIQNDKTRDEAEKQWNLNDKAYQKHYLQIREKLPKHFIKIYEKEYGFHDFIISEIRITPKIYKTKRNQVNIFITLNNAENQYVVEFKNVVSAKFNYADNIYCIGGNIAWGYTEFEILDNKQIKMSVLCDIKNEFEFVFTNVVIKKC